MVPLGMTSEVANRTHTTKTTPWSTSYVDDAGIVFRSAASLAKTMAAVVQVCEGLGLTVSEKMWQAILLRPPGTPTQSASIATAGQMYAKMEQFVHLGGTISAGADMYSEVERRAKVAWGAFRKDFRKLYDTPTTVIPLLKALKMRLLRAEVCKALLYAGETWCPHQK